MKSDYWSVWRSIKGLYCFCTWKKDWPLKHFPQFIWLLNNHSSDINQRDCRRLITTRMENQLKSRFLMNWFLEINERRSSTEAITAISQSDADKHWTLVWVIKRRCSLPVSCQNVKNENEDENLITNSRRQRRTGTIFDSNTRKLLLWPLGGSGSVQAVNFFFFFTTTCFYFNHLGCWKGESSSNPDRSVAYINRPVARLLYLMKAAVRYRRATAGRQKRPNKHYRHGRRHAILMSSSKCPA